MTNVQIEKLCKEKEQELMKKYFSNLVKEAAKEEAETIGEYTKDLPLKIESEYKAYLEDMERTCSKRAERQTSYL